MGLLKKMAESIPDRCIQAGLGVEPRSQEESLVNCGYQEGCLEAAPMPLSDTEAWGRVPALSRGPVVVRGCPSGVLASETRVELTSPHTGRQLCLQGGPSLEEDSMNRLLRSPSHPLTRAPGEPLEGSSPAGKQEVPLPPPHRQPEWASQSKVRFPGEGRESLLPSAPTEACTPFMESVERSGLVSGGIPVSGGVRVPGNDMGLAWASAGGLGGHLRTSADPMAAWELDGTAADSVGP